MTAMADQQAMHSPMSGLGVIVMAAGLGKRMKSNHVKVLHQVAGQPMVLYAVDVALRVGGHRIAVVVGHQAEKVRQVIEAGIAGKPGAQAVSIVEQTQQLGTGHAVMQSRSVFSHHGEASPTHYLILNGDTPLLKESTVRELLTVHQREGATVTILTARLDDPSGYGRVIRHDASPGDPALLSSGVEKIVEDRDATPAERATKEINVGTYVVSGAFLFEALDKLEPDNAQGEYYLTDIVRMAVAQGRRVAAVTLQNPDEGLGVNTRQQLAEAEQVVRQQIREGWLDAGVTMRDPGSVWIDAGVTIGKDTVLYPHVMLEGNTVIGEETTIRSGVRITDCVIGNHVEVLDCSVLSQSRIDDDTHVGPFVHLRPGVVVRRRAKVGNFVEMKKTELGEGSKANHLSYLGDATIAEGVNIGAGTITCNYDGQKKHHTMIGKNVFLGSDTQLVAPVTIGEGAVIAAGTTVTQNVPADSLAIARVPQANLIGWVAKRRALVARATPGVVSSVKAPGKRATVTRQKASAKSKKGPGRSSRG
ncbi:MAG: bifunctional UDP-N-acetylglucosamine diphosphorylase/glucosamine-1-phosphate N-acetyltransferase GlmU [Nitrospira sp.]|nr:bifunctional UDP-N-acetylglucosamine diphosphorylase/glucosamine-1-phosphate N-acetyltransferase GlmU [Nitrospira sp.]MDH4303821.1 bifunctional UDP-N-acetylglucosamine diphosphorylase/glucosamine-1-phosphate N-acetyltransferase GlmU [Nitrospira sp.]